MPKDSAPEIDHETVLSMTTKIVAAYVSNNSPPSADIPTIIQSVFGALMAPGGNGGTGNEPPQKPAVSIRRSITPDFIICLEDGKKLKMLKRHLRSTYGLTPDEYRSKWGLAADYPMVAPNYAAQRSAFAKSIGLGRKRKTTGRRAKKK